MTQVEYTKVVYYLGGFLSFSTWYMHK